MKKVILTGSSGMIGKGVLLECLDDERISEILLVNRSATEMKHSKIKEVLLSDFTQIVEKKAQLRGYDACFFCMGVSSVGMSKEQYFSITYEATKAFADVLYELNSNLVFNYVSGTGTDSQEQGSGWQAVKGKAENAVLNKGFQDAYLFRPGGIIPERGIKSRTTWYNVIYAITRPLFPLFRKSKNITTTTKIGEAMINTLFHSQALKHLENKDINALAAK